MPVVTFHLVSGAYPADSLGRLLGASAQVYCDVLGTPVDRVRVFVRTYEPEHCLVGGVVVGDGGNPAPYFEFVLLAGRPPEHRRRLLRAFTDLLVDHLGADRGLVRGRAVEVEPDDWGIAGEPAGVRRADEIRARAGAPGR